MDDNDHFLSAARCLLEREGLSVLGVASSSVEAVRLVGDLLPDVVLVDVDLGTESGLDLARELAAEPRASVVLISAHSEAELADLVDLSPAVGFIPKQDLSVAAIATVLADVEHGA